MFYNKDKRMNKKMFYPSAGRGNITIQGGNANETENYRKKVFVDRQDERQDREEAFKI